MKQNLAAGLQGQTSSESATHTLFALMLELWLSQPRVRPLPRVTSVWAFAECPNTLEQTPTSACVCFLQNAQIDQALADYACSLTSSAYVSNSWMWTS